MGTRVSRRCRAQHLPSGAPCCCLSTPALGPSCPEPWLTWTRDRALPLWVLGPFSPCSLSLAWPALRSARLLSFWSWLITTSQLVRIASRGVTLSSDSETVLRGPRWTGQLLLLAAVSPPAASVLLPCCSASAAFSSYSYSILDELVLRSHLPGSGWCPGAAGSGSGGGSRFQSGMGRADPAVKVQMTLWQMQLPDPAPERWQWVCGGRRGSNRAEIGSWKFSSAVFRARQQRGGTRLEGRRPGGTSGGLWGSSCPGIDF